MRPTGGGEHGNAPGTVTQDSRDRRTHVEATFWRWRGRIGGAAAVCPTADKTAITDYLTAIAVDRHCHHRPVEASSVIVQVQHGIEEGVSEAGMVEWAIGIGDVDLGLQQFPGKILGSLGMAAQQTFGTASLTPYVRPTTAPLVDDIGIEP